MVEWRELQGFSNYLVSNTGDVKSLFTGRLCKYNIKVGYPTVGIYADNVSKPKNKSIHRLVAQAFIPNPENKPQVNHIDGNKLNNHVSNLEWVTSKQNMSHAILLGLSSNQRGILNNKAKLDELSVIVLRDACSNGFKLKDVASYFNIDYRYASCIKNRKFWKHV